MYKTHTKSHDSTRSFFLYTIPNATEPLYPFSPYIRESRQGIKSISKRALRLNLVILIVQLDEPKIYQNRQFERLLYSTQYATKANPYLKLAVLKPIPIETNEIFFDMYSLTQKIYMHKSERLVALQH